MRKSNLNILNIFFMFGECKKEKFLLVMVGALSLLGSFTVSADPGGITSENYGNIYLREYPGSGEHPWRLSAVYGYEYSAKSPEAYGVRSLNVHNMALSLEHSLGDHFWLGVQGSKWFGGSDDLSDLNNPHRPLSPTWAVSVIGTVVPLKGHFSFFGVFPLAAELGLRIGVGQTWLLDHEPLRQVTVSLRPVFEVSQRFSIQFAFTREIVLPFSSANAWDSNFRVESGLGVHF